MIVHGGLQYQLTELGHILLHTQFRLHRDRPRLSKRMDELDWEPELDILIDGLGWFDEQV